MATARAAASSAVPVERATRPALSTWWRVIGFFGTDHRGECFPDVVASAGAVPAEPGSPSVADCWSAVGGVVCATFALLATFASLAALVSSTTVVFSRPGHAKISPARRCHPDICAGPVHKTRTRTRSEIIDGRCVKLACTGYECVGEREPDDECRGAAARSMSGMRLSGDRSAGMCGLCPIADRGARRARRRSARPDRRRIAVAS